MFKKYIIIILFITGICEAQQIPFSFLKSTTSLAAPVVVFYDKPVNMQLYQRDSDDSATVTISGQVSSLGYDSVYVELYRNDTLIKSNSMWINYLLTTNFTITHRIKARLAQYKTKTYVKYSSTSILMSTVDSLACGDIFIIMGQSNAQNPDTLCAIDDQYCRTFGVQTDSLNTSNYNKADTSWSRSSANYNDFAILPRGNYPKNVGVWAMQLQKYIRDTCGIPTAVINGTRWGTSITSHMRNNANPTDSSTYYGKVLYRMQKSGLASKVKAVFWYQGEIDVNAPDPTVSQSNPRGIAGYSNYENKFDSLRSSLRSDYTSLAKIFVMQIRPLSCAGTSVFGQELRESQRQFQNTYTDVQVISTNGIGSYSNCHYAYAGYIQIAQVVFKNVGQIYYGATDTTNCRPPTVRRAFFTSSAKTKIGIVFNNSSPSAVPSDSLSNSIKNYFFLNKLRTTAAVSSVSISNDTMYLNLSAATTSTRLGYIPNMSDAAGSVYNGPWIRNARGLAMLSFNNVTIYEPESIALFTRTSTVTRGREIIMDSLIKRYKANNVWTGDALYLYANADTGLANVNWLSGTADSFRCVQNGTITFTADKGYTSNGSSGYLNTQFRPGVSGVYFTLKTGAAAVYNHTNFTITGTEQRPFGARTTGTNSYIGMILRTSFGGPDKFYTNMNDANALGMSNTDSRGLFVTNRTDTLTVSAYKNYNGITGILGTHSTQPAQSRSTNSIFVCGYNSEGTAANFFTGRIAMFRIGGTWSTTQIRDFTTHTEWYLTHVGASFTQP